MRSDKETFAEAVTPYNASVYSKIYLAAVCPRIKRVPWIPEEDVIVLRMRDKDSCSWEEIHNILLYQTPKVIRGYYYTIRAGVGKANVSGG
jgi:hypothetical protein